MELREVPDYYPEGDANTLVQAELIRKDPERFKAAQEAAKKMVEEQKANMAGLKKIASKKV